MIRRGVKLTAAGFLLTLACLVIIAATVVTCVVALLTLPVVVVYAVLCVARDRYARRRAAKRAGLPKYAGWSGRFEDLPTIPDNDRNTSPRGGAR